MWLVISEGGEGGGGHATTAKASIPITHASAHDSLQSNPLNCSPTVKPRPRCNGEKKIARKKHHRFQYLQWWNWTPNSCHLPTRRARLDSHDKSSYRRPRLTRTSMYTQLSTLRYNTCTTFSVIDKQQAYCYSNYICDIEAMHMYVHVHVCSRHCPGDRG